ncbi:transcriptional regulator [uncultured Bacteroides sp.]|uniref:transcriptional regulator n=1 Tax=uncultured Bacteroides sp. TaxID=162156 RepID=UPI002AA5E359|nr:transcriptional regulator [uncultured Bacteroides sp.]
MTKPSITIELAPHLHDFLYHEFDSRKDGGVMINSSNDIGKMVQAMVTVNDRPPKIPLKDNPITLILPITEWNHRILIENFIFIPEWKQRMLQEYIESSYRIRIREYFVAGYEKGYKQDKIIKAFLMAYNIKNNAINYDAVKKFDYRNRKRIVKEVNKDIQLSLFE